MFSFFLMVNMAEILMTFCIFFMWRWSIGCWDRWMAIWQAQTGPGLGSPIALGSTKNQDEANHHKKDPWDPPPAVGNEAWESLLKRGFFEVQLFSWGDFCIVCWFLRFKSHQSQVFFFNSKINQWIWEGLKICYLQYWKMDAPNMGCSSSFFPLAPESSGNILERCHRKAAVLGVYPVFIQNHISLAVIISDSILAHDISILWLVLSHHSFSCTAIWVASKPQIDKQLMILGHYTSLYIYYGLPGYLTVCY